MVHLPLPSSPLPVHRRLGAHWRTFSGSLAAGPPSKRIGGFPSKLATLPSMLREDMKDLGDEIVPAPPLGLSNFRLIPLLLLLNIWACKFCCCCWNGYLCAVAPNWNCTDNGWTIFGGPNWWALLLLELTKSRLRGCGGAPTWGRSCAAEAADGDGVGALPDMSIPNGVLLLLSKKPFWLKNPTGFLLLENLPLACPPLPPPPLLRRETTFLNLAQASPVSEAMLLSRAGSCCWESKASNLWQLSTAALLAASTSSMAQEKSIEKQI